MISDEQYDSLSKDDTLNLDKIILEIKMMKIGRGNNFLPRNMEDLLAKLKEWMAIYPDEQQPDIKKNIMAALDELRFRKVIEKEKYNDILKDMS